MKNLAKIALTFVLTVGHERADANDLLDACLRINERLRKNDFPHTRRFSDYFVEFRESFIWAIAPLGANDVWLDSGAGSGGAIHDYQDQKKFMHPDEEQPVLFNSAGPAAVIAVNLNPPADHFLTHDQLPGFTKWAHLENKPVEGISTEKLTQFGKINLITDVYGPMSYSFFPHLVLRKYIDILKSDGQILLTRMPTTTVVVNDETLTFHQWLKNIDGLVVESLNWRAHDKREVEQFPERHASVEAQLPMRIRLKSDPSTIKVPQLKFTGLADEQPPARVFEQVAPANF